MNMNHLRVQTSHFGNPEHVLELGKTRTLLPGSNEAVVALRAAPINPSDVLTIRGVYSARTPLPLTPGFEGVGTVVALGESVSNLNLGDVVLPLRGQGTWQEYVVAPASHCVRVPDGWSVAESAQLYINPLSAWLMLRQTLTDLQGRWIALNAANSATGRLLIQFAVHMGARVIAVVRGRNPFSSLIELGATHVVDTEQESIYEAVMHHTQGLGVAATFDAVGGAPGAELASALSPEGTMVHYGLLSGEPLPECVNARHFWLRKWVNEVDGRLWRETFEKLFLNLKRWNIRLPDVQTY